jgi:small conductance mechanosensitive channel
VFVLILFHLSGWLVTYRDWPFRSSHGKILLQNRAFQFVRYIFIFAGFLVALEITGLTALIGAFIGAAGIIGLALGFAFKDIVENYVTGFLLSVRSPFAFMDWIGVGEHEGSVVRVTSRELVIMTLQGNHCTSPTLRSLKA